MYLGFIPNSQTFTHLVYMMSKRGKKEEVMDLLSDMEGFNIMVLLV